MSSFAFAMPPQSRLTFWLLLAATVCVDAVAVYWIFLFPDLASEEIVDALSSGQLSVACIWWSFRKDRRGLSAVVLALLALAATGVLAIPPYITFLDSLAINASHVFGVLAGLWITKRTAWWCRVTHSEVARSWQFSVGQLLVVTTVVATLIVVLKSAALMQEAWAIVALIVLGDVAMAIAALFAVHLGHHPLLRLAAAWTAALFIAAAITFLHPGYFRSFAAFYLLQAVVLMLWLENGNIIPSAESERESEAAGQQPSVAQERRE